MLGLMLQHQTAQLGGVQIGDDEHRQTQRQGQVYAAGIAVGDKGGHNVHQLLPAAHQLVKGSKLLGNGVEVGVAEHHALGGAGGAAGVYDYAGMGGVRKGSAVVFWPLPFWIKSFQ